MRRPVRPRLHAPSVCYPGGQVGRGLTCALGLMLATPTHAAQSPSPSPPVTSDEPITPSRQVDPDPPPDGQDEAIRQFRAARDLYSAGAYAEAARGFEGSYAAAASPEAAYNAALAHDKTGDDLATMTWYRRYLATAPPEDPSYPQAQQRATELRARLGELRLQLDSSEEIREIRVNGEAVMLADFPKLVPPGHVELRLTGAGTDEVADIPAEVAPGGTWTVQFTGFARPELPASILRPMPRVVRPDPRPVVPAPRVRPLTALFWTGTGLTTTSAIAMGVLGGLVLRERAGYEDCGQTGTCREAGASFHRYQNATNAMVGVTAGLAVITLALGIAAMRDRRKTSREPAVGRVRVTLAGLQLAF